MGIIKDAAKVDDLVDKQIEDAVEAELVKKGLTKVNGDSADLFIGYQTSAPRNNSHFSTPTARFVFGLLVGSAEPGILPRY